MVCRSGIAGSVEYGLAAHLIGERALTDVPFREPLSEGVLSAVRDEGSPQKMQGDGRRGMV